MSVLSQTAALLFRRPSTQRLGKLEIDVVSSNNISERALVTHNPVEKSYITDHIRHEPAEITINGIISKFSLKNALISRVSSFGTNTQVNRLQEAHDELYRLWNNQEPLDLVMKYKIYESMVLTGLEIPADATNGDSLRFTVMLKQVLIATSQVALLSNSRVKTDSAKSLVKTGRKTTESKTLSTKQPKITLTQFLKSLF